MRMISEEMRSSLSHYAFPTLDNVSAMKNPRRADTKFFQYGVELIGASGPLAEAEVVSLAIYVGILRTW